MKMKKFYALMLGAMACTAVAVSCSDDDEKEPASSSVSTITATVENGNSYNSKVDTVKLMVGFEVGEDWINEPIAAVPYTNGGFSIQLPASVPSKYLEVLEPAEGMKMSKANVKGASGEFFGFKSGEFAGRFSYAKMSEKETAEVALTYVDSDVTATGKQTLSETYKDESGADVTIKANYSYNISLKTGWNFIYMIGSRNGNTITLNMTTANPGGMKWYYFDHTSSYDAPAAAKKVSAFKPFKR